MIGSRFIGARLPLLSSWRRVYRREYGGACLTPREFDVVIVGGGVMGCSSAFHLISRDPSLRVCVVERDSTYAKASSVLSVSSIRQQFSLEENIQLSRYSLRFLRELGDHLSIPGEDPPDAQLVEQGYLLLASEQGVPVMEENHVVQRRCGCHVELFSANQLREKFPWLNTDGIALGSFGYRDEGWFDPWALLSGMRRKAKHLGVEYIDGEVTSLDCQDEVIRSALVSTPDGHLSLNCQWLVNTAGAWAGGVCEMAHIGDLTHRDPRMHWELPVKPRKRTVYTIHCADASPLLCSAPLTIDPSGTYFRPEGKGGVFVTAKPPLEDFDCEDFEVDYNFFDDYIWPVIADRVPSFEAIKVKSAWVGLYEYNTFDQNAILGNHPVLQNLILANGFSGHGIQQSPAVGRIVSDIILHGNTDIVDLTKMSFQRIIDQSPLLEKNVI